MSTASRVVPLMGETTRTRTTAEWIALLEDNAAPCGPINTLASAFADPQVQARGLVKKQAVVPANSAGNAPEKIATSAAKGAAEIRTVASPMRLSAAPAQLRYAPPALGEHTTEVLRELGLDAARIQTLQQQGIV